MLQTMDILRSGSENGMVFIKTALEIVGVIGLVVQVVLLILHYQNRRANWERFSLLYILMHILLGALQMTITSAYGAFRDVFASDSLTYFFWCLLGISILLLGVEVILLLKPFKKPGSAPNGVD